MVLVFHEDLREERLIAQMKLAFCKHYLFALQSQFSVILIANEDYWPEHKSFFQVISFIILKVMFLFLFGSGLLKIQMCLSRVLPCLSSNLGDGLPEHLWVLPGVSWELTELSGEFRDFCEHSRRLRKCFRKAPC